MSSIKTDKKVVGKKNIIPSDIKDLTIEELLSLEDVEIHKKNNTLKVKRTTPTETLSIEIRQFEGTASILYSNKANNKFNQMGKTISKLREEGKTQKEVADILGTTQTNISKIERNLKNKNN